MIGVANEAINNRQLTAEEIEHEGNGAKGMPKDDPHQWRDNSVENVGIAHHWHDKDIRKESPRKATRYKKKNMNRATVSATAAAESFDVV